MSYFSDNYEPEPPFARPRTLYVRVPHSKVTPEEDFATPLPTNQEALLEKHKDVDLFAKDIVADSWNDDHGFYYLPDGSQTADTETAIELVKTWLLSPAEEE